MFGVGAGSQKPGAGSQEPEDGKLMTNDLVDVLFLLLAPGFYKFNFFLSIQGILAISRE